MAMTPLADGRRRYQRYRRASMLIGIAGVLLVIVGIAQSIVLLVVLGMILSVIVGFALWLAANSTMARAIDQAAYLARREHMPPRIPEIVHRLNVGQFHEALELQSRVGGALDEVYQSRFGVR